VPITLRQLRYFQALVEHGSFSRAAESVYVSQPALSLQIRELEASLGGPLVERESRGIHLTRLGREAHEQTLRILDETNFLELMGKQFDEGRAQVSLGIVSTLSAYLLPGLLRRCPPTCFRACCSACRTRRPGSSRVSSRRPETSSSPTCMRAASMRQSWPCRSE